MRTIIFISFCLFIIFPSCMEKEKKATVDLVKNPLSADKNLDIPMPKIYLEEEVFARRQMHLRSKGCDI